MRLLGHRTPGLCRLKRVPGGYGTTLACILLYRPLGAGKLSRITRRHRGALVSLLGHRAPGLSRLKRVPGGDSPSLVSMLFDSTT